MKLKIKNLFLFNKNYFSTKKGIGIIKEQKKREFESKKIEEMKKNNDSSNENQSNKKLLYENSIVKVKLLSTICFCGFYGGFNLFYSHMLCDFGSLIRKEYFNLSIMSFIPMISVQIGFLIGNIISKNKKSNNHNDVNKKMTSRFGSYNVDLILIYGSSTILGFTLLPFLKSIFPLYIMCNSVM